MNIEKNGQKDIFIAGDNRLIILIHGFMGSPYNFRFMANHFSELGYTVWVPLLMEHNSLEKFGDSLPIEWYEDLKERVIKEIDNDRYTIVHIVGLSLGGAFATRLSIEVKSIKIKTLTLLAAPYRLKKTQQFLLHLFGYSLLNRVYPYRRRKESDIKHQLQRTINSREKMVSIRLIFGLSYFLKENIEFIKKVDKPTFIIHSKKDNTVPFSQSNYYFKKIKTKIKYKLTLTKSFHILPLDIERDLTFYRVERFFIMFE
ncbi:alpha/beta fold hydrolase [bacterium]|nr:alpha/beta fold hydrolase [bacterium]